jgi:hypothetical protein
VLVVEAPDDEADDEPPSLAEGSVVDTTSVVADPRPLDMNSGLDLRHPDRLPRTASVKHRTIASITTAIHGNLHRFQLKQVATVVAPLPEFDQWRRLRPS